MSQQAAANYLRTKVLTATPEQLQLMLYDGAIRFTEQARAALEKKDKKPPALATADVEKFMSGGKEKARRFERIDTDNRLRVRELGGRVVECVTAYKGEAVHRQWLDGYVLEAPEEKNYDDKKSGEKKSGEKKSEEKKK